MIDLSNPGSVGDVNYYKAISRYISFWRAKLGISQTLTIPGRQLASALKGSLSNFFGLIIDMIGDDMKTLFIREITGNGLPLTPG